MAETSACQCSPRKISRDSVTHRSRKCCNTNNLDTGVSHVLGELSDDPTMVSVKTMVPVINCMPER